ncbi:hypothetical protein SRABI106_03963 [Rahnella aquatilis]|nr:hypothetical protein SRABI106_03963 [Rahnella aquatilis]
MLGVSALRRLFGETIITGVSPGVTFAAQLFFTFFTLIAFLTTVYHATDGNMIAWFVAGDAFTNAGDTSDDFMAGNNRIIAPAPVISCGM